MARPTSLLDGTPVVMVDWTAAPSATFTASPLRRFVAALARPMPGRRSVLRTADTPQQLTTEQSPTCTHAHGAPCRSMPSSRVS
eukprot:scaffold169875_cov26-Tisochrysis_lutea.AAC.3